MKKQNQTQTLKSVFLLFIIGLSFNSGAVWAYRQPAMESTLRELHRARESLQHALPNKGEHREKALRLIDRAIREVQMGIEFANRQGKNNSDKRKYKDDRYTGDRSKKEKMMEKRRDTKEQEKELKEPEPVPFDKGKLERRY